MKLSRIDRIQKVLTVATLFPQLDPTSVTSISVGLLAPRDTPTAATTWTANSVTAGAATVLFVGSDADSTGAVVVTATADLWAKASGSFGEVEAVLVERITLMGSAAQIAAPLPIPPVLTVQGRTGAVVLSAADVGAASTTDSRLSDARAATDASVAALVNNGASSTTGALRAAYVTYLILAGTPDSIIAGTITRDANGAATSAPVVWPDGSPGTYTADTVSTAFPGAVDAYHITYGSPVTKTYTQAAVTRDSTSGAVTVRPAMTVA